MRIIHNYILKELLGPFLLALVIFTFILVMGNLIKLSEMVINKGVALTSVLKLFLYLVPYLFSYTIPMAVLTATLLGMGRLSQDNEIIACLASGIGIHQLIKPLLAAGFILSLACVPLNDQILTQAHFASRRMAKEIGLKSPTAALEAGTFIRAFPGYIIFIYALEDNEMFNIRIYQPQEGKATRTIVAERGEFLSIPEKNKIKMRLFNGTLDEPDPNKPGAFHRLDFQEYELPLNLAGLDENVQAMQKKPKDMSISELRKEIVSLKKLGVDETTPLSVQIHNKLSSSFSSLALIIIGFPLAVRVGRKDRSFNFGLSLGVIVFYYLLFALGEALALKKLLPVAFGVWLPNLALSAIGAFLIFRFSKR